MIRERNVEDHVIIVLEKVPELASIEQSNKLKGILQKLFEDEKTKSIVVDLGKIDFLNSSVVGMLISGQKTARLKNTDFALLNVNAKLLEMFELASIKELFTIYHNEHELLSSKQ